MDHEIEITRLAHGGDGIGTVDGQICFVPGTLPGDVVHLSSLEKRKGVLWGKSAGRIRESENRTAVDCPVFGICGGCSWLDFAYPQQGQWKRRIVEDCFKRIGKTQVEVAFREVPTLRMGYRTRATFHGNDGAWGYYAEGSHTTVAIETCPLHHEKLNNALEKIQGLDAVGPLEITVNPEGEEVLVWCVDLSGNLLEVFPQAQSARSGERRHQFEFDSVPVINGAFVQSSLLLNRLLRSTVQEALGTPKNLLDLYCGSGNLSLSLADQSEVTGIDHDGVAIMAASRKDRGEYRIGGETAMAELITERPWGAILLDPPRTGARALTKSLAQADCPQIIYIACDPAALARDTRQLLKAGWKIQSATALDLFPHTPHIETVCCFVR